MSEEDRKVIAAMKRYGGSFVKALAEAACLADDSNLARIKSAWPDYWANYASIAVTRDASIDDEL